jgi:hypothetical protein
VIDTLVIDTLELREKNTEMDWFTDGASLFDFADGGGSPRRGLEWIADQCTVAFS